MREWEGLWSATFHAWAAVEVDHPGELVFAWVIVGGWDDGGLVFPDAAGEDFESVGGRGGFGIVFWDEEVVFGDFELAFSVGSLVLVLDLVIVHCHFYHCPRPKSFWADPFSTSKMASNQLSSCFSGPSRLLGTVQVTYQRSDATSR